MTWTRCWLWVPVISTSPHVWSIEMILEAQWPRWHSRDELISENAKISRTADFCEACEAMWSYVKLRETKAATCTLSSRCKKSGMRNSSAPPTRDLPTRCETSYARHANFQGSVELPRAPLAFYTNGAFILLRHFATPALKDRKLTLACSWQQEFDFSPNLTQLGSTWLMSQQILTDTLYRYSIRTVLDILFFECAMC